MTEYQFTKDWFNWAPDAFTNIFGETAEIIHVGYQLVVRKKG